MTERALRDAQFYIALLEDFSSYAMNIVFSKSEFRETIGEPTGTWVHIYPGNQKIANLAVNDFDLLASIFGIKRNYVGLRIFSEENKLFEFYFADNPRFRSILDPVSVVKQSTIWAYPHSALAFNVLNFTRTPELNKQIIRSLKESAPPEANKVLAFSCISVVPLMHKITLEITVPSYSDAVMLRGNYISDFLRVARKFKEIDLVYFFIGLDEEDRLCCGRYELKK